MPDPKCTRCQGHGFTDYAGFCMEQCPCVVEQSAAIVAAAAASCATAELLRFAREGQMSPSFAFAEETVALLGSAMLAALKIEHPRACTLARDFAGDCPASQEGPNAILEMQRALTRFLEVFQA